MAAHANAKGVDRAVEWRRGVVEGLDVFMEVFMEMSPVKGFNAGQLAGAAE